MSCGLSCLLCTGGQTQASSTRERPLVTSWRPDEDSLPRGWRLRAVRRSGSERPVYQYLSPENTVYQSRAEILRYMNRCSHLFSQSDISKVRAFEYKRKDTEETKKWVDFKIRKFRKKVPKRKKLVTNQVVVTTRMKMLRRAVVDNDDLPEKTFRYEPVIFVPKLTNVINNFNIEAILSSNIEASIPTNCVHTDEGRENNIEELKGELKDRQLDYDGKISEDELEPESKENGGASSALRSLRYKTRTVYEEAPLEEEIDKKVFVQMMLQSKFSEENNDDIEEDDDNDEDEDAYLSDASNRGTCSKGRERMRFNDEDLAILEEWFDKNPYPKRKERKEISQILMVPAKTVRIWFQNKRCKTEDGKTKSMLARQKKKIQNTSSKNGYSSNSENDDEEEETLCTKCNQTFSTRWNLKIHQKRFHKENNSSSDSFDCKHCDKLFSTKWDMKTHIMENHRNLSPEKEVYDHPQDHQTTSSDDPKGNGKRTRFEPIQLQGLRRMFQWNKYPASEDMLELSSEIGLTVRSITGWFTNMRHRDKVRKEEAVRNNILEWRTGQMFQESNQMGHQTKSPKKETWQLRPDQTGSNDHQVSPQRHQAPSWSPERVPRGSQSFDIESSDEKLKYNPGHKKTKFNDYQRTYLKNFFLNKEYVEEDDISELSAELMLSPKVLRIWFQHARERKKKNLPIITPVIGRGRGRGRGRPPLGNPPRGRGRPKKVVVEDDDEGLFDLNEDSLSNDIPRRPLIFASKSRGKTLDNSTESNDEMRLTEFQKVFLEDFYSETKEPDSDHLKYICEHINASRENIMLWFKMKNSANRISSSGSFKICEEILSEVVQRIGGSVEDSFPCPYCGKYFADEESLKKHERLEAIEFEKEARSFNEKSHLEEPEEFDEEKYTEFNDYSADISDDDDDDDDFDEMAYFKNSSYYDEIIESTLSGKSPKQSKDSTRPKIKRPMNPFMLWLQEERKKAGQVNKKKGMRTTGELVKELSVKWKQMTETEKAPYVEEAQALKVQHKQEHPDYQYHPNRRKTIKQDQPTSDLSNFPENIEYQNTGSRRGGFKGFLCKRCQVGFTTKGNLFKHLRQFHPENPYDSSFYELDMEEGEDDSFFSTSPGKAQKRTLDMDEEPVTFEAFRKYFDTEDVERDPQNFFEKKPYKSPVKDHVGSSSAPSYDYLDDGGTEPRDAKRPTHTKTRFTEDQRKVLLESFHQSISMSKVEAKQLYDDLADSLQLPTKIVRIWFQNARSARKKGNSLFI